MKRILVTGGAGFIGSHVSERLLKDSFEVIILDNFDEFYSSEIKRKNIAYCISKENCTLVESDISEITSVAAQIGQVDAIIHLAARAGVRPSILNPDLYFQTNVNGTLQVLEFAKKHSIKKLVFASSSSVYGKNVNVPWQESDSDLLPISPYAASKIAAEKICYVFSHLFGLNISVLRFFTVYGPRQRPDLAIHKFVRGVLNNEPIPVFGDGTTSRDYTYIDDIVEGIVSALQYNRTSFEVFNLGNNHGVQLRVLLDIIEQELGIKAIINKQPEQPGDVAITYANIAKAKRLLRYNPKTDIQTGIRSFISWYKENIYRS